MLVRVKTIDQHLVEAEIGGKGEAIGGVEVDGVGMRPCLPILVYARAAMLHDNGRFAQRAVFANRQHADAAAAVVCREDILAALVNDEVTWSGTARGLLIEQLQIAGCGVDGKSTDAAG